MRHAPQLCRVNMCFPEHSNALAVRSNQNRNGLLWTGATPANTSCVAYGITDAKQRLHHLRGTWLLQDKMLEYDGYPPNCCFKGPMLWKMNSTSVLDQ